MSHNINNTFGDIPTQIGYIIPFERQLTQEEASRIIIAHRNMEMKSLFNDWISEKENKEWKGDVDKKKYELWRNHRTPNSTVFVFGPDIHRVLGENC